MDHRHAVDSTLRLAFRHRLRFGRDVLDPADTTLADALIDGERLSRVLAFLDTGVAKAFPGLPDRLRTYAAAHGDRFTLAGRVEPVVGGELCKNDRDAMYRVLAAIEAAGLDRRSVVLVIGGGAVLDCVGFAAAIAHRGMRLVRLPTTTLAQADSGVGVKNGINGFGQKNYLGSFAVPWAVVNDAAFLATLDDRDWRSGFSEALKVALIKDADFFDELQRLAPAVARRDEAAALPLIQRSALLHVAHISQGGDPFELDTARPLDFGHWSAHRLESLTGHALRHGEAVAIGIALDVAYASTVGLLDEAVADATHDTLRTLGFELFHEAMHDADALLIGLEQFRAHLGGELTITLPTAPGRAIDVHTIDEAAMRSAIASLAPRQAMR